MTGTETLTEKDRDELLPNGGLPDRVTDARNAIAWGLIWIGFNKAGVMAIDALRKIATMWGTGGTLLVGVPLTIAMFCVVIGVVGVVFRTVCQIIWSRLKEVSRYT